MKRREFVGIAGASALGAFSARAANETVNVSVAPGFADSAPVAWARTQLESALSAHGSTVKAGVPQRNELSIVIAPPNPGRGAEDVGISASPDGRLITITSGGEQGAVFSILELADRLRNSTTGLSVLRAPAEERPATHVRSITRLFTSDVHDKPWYNDREMWPQYLSMLAANRFNRFNLSFGIGYDFLQNVTDAYFLFTYPFLLAVPGYNVRVPQISDAERDSNLAMLKYITEQTVARGMEFQLGLWMHGYKWLNSPNPKHTIEGLNDRNHGPYCRDAVRLLLKECPAISGVTFRVHGESGVEEGSFDFWKTVFEGVATCGRRVRIDMHAKGMNQDMIDIALATGLPISISPKYWAEHMGMPYNQADIREQERPKPGKDGGALMKYSAGSRSFTRYGYCDLLREDRKWTVLTRVWPGTQRLLLWGDPVTAAAHAQAFSFCGEDGVEICEPLSFKGRRGSGLPGDRCGYADTQLQTRWDWQKYEYTYRIWGRLLYNPKAAPDQWQRALRKDFGVAAVSVEAALANASRILPLVTTAHCPSAANNVYWPELYTNQSIVTPAKGEPYTDTPSPRVFGNAEPLDPQLFYRVNDFADAALANTRDGRYTPPEVAKWLDDYAARAANNLADASAKAKSKHQANFRRMSIDVSIQAGLGQFFAAKLRAGVLYRIYETTGDREALEQAISQYRAARTAWAGLSEIARGVYVSDITVGEHPQLRGHWLNRLPGIDADIANMAAKLDTSPGTGPRHSTLIQEITDHPVRTLVALRHEAPRTFQAGKPLELRASAPANAALRLFYRRVTHEERWQSMAMVPQDGQHAAQIPGTYTNSAYPLQYYFEVAQPGMTPAIFPGFTPGHNNQPYFVIRQARG